MSTATFAEKMLAKLEELMLTNVGVQSVSIDGQSVSYIDLQKQHAYWAKQVAIEQGTNPTITTINLRNAQ